MFRQLWVRGGVNCGLGWTGAWSGETSFLLSSTTTTTLTRALSLSSPSPAHIGQLGSKHEPLIILLVGISQLFTHLKFEINPLNRQKPKDIQRRRKSRRELAGKGWLVGSVDSLGAQLSGAPVFQGPTVHGPTVRGPICLTSLIPSANSNVWNISSGHLTRENRDKNKDKHQNLQEKGGWWDV